MDMFTVKKKEEVQRILGEAFSNVALETETVAIEKCVGRVLAKEIKSVENIPGFQRSTVDGYAARSIDTIGACEAMPALLTVIGETVMGHGTRLMVTEMQAVYVPTGGIVPDGADAMIMVEYTEVFGDEVAIYTPGAPLSHIVGIGDDVKENELVIGKHTILKPQHVGVLASLGQIEVSVLRKPKVGIISTGDELVALDAPMTIGQIRDVNTYVLKTLLEGLGCDVIGTERLKDDYNLIQETLKGYVNKCDLVLLSGGSSVGNHDHAPEIINSIGEPGVLVHGIAIKPGKPTIVGKVDSCAVFGLPGHPASCVIAYKAIVEPFIMDTLMNVVSKAPLIRAKSGFQMHVSSGRDVFFMVRLEEDGNQLIAHPVQGKSGMVSLFSMADGFIEIPMEKEGIEIGDDCFVRLF